jgi:hypothetical protein
MLIDCMDKEAIDGWISHPSSEKDYYLSNSMNKLSKNRLQKSGFLREGKVYNNFIQSYKIKADYYYVLVKKYLNDEWDSINGYPESFYRESSGFTKASKKNPWQLSSSQITIIDIYEAEVTGEVDDDFMIEFYDSEMEIVEAMLPKKEFEEHPGDVKKGTAFGIVLYRQQGEYAPKIGAWPIQEYWNKSLIQ